MKATKGGNLSTIGRNDVHLPGEEVAFSSESPTPSG